jgi:uncharacterized protein (TIGR00299 family) protein
MADLIESVASAQLPETVHARVRRVLARLGEAEARVHGGSLHDVVLHELGEDDTLLDVVGVAAALDALGIESVEVSSIPLGEPGPATLELLRGFHLYPAPGPGETVTPTGAAILAALGRSAEGIPEISLDAVGYGGGSRDPVGAANVVRVMVGVPAGESREAPDEALVRELVVLEANLDDLSPELVADAARALLAAGALDAWTSGVLMKKGRSGVMLSALCEPASEARLIRSFFESTTTFGVRSHRVRRTELTRRMASVTVADRTVRVKIGLLGARLMSVKPEHDDVAAVAARAGRPVKEVYEEAAAAARALRYELIEG